jgi:hypothetical protein
VILQQCSTENSIKHFKWFRNESWLGNFNCWQLVELSMSWLQIRFSPDYKQDVREALKINCPYCDHHDHLEIDLHADGFSADLLECTECGALLTMKGASLETVHALAKKFGIPAG